MSSNYNSRYKPAEVLFYNNKEQLIRKKENMIDILNNQILVELKNPEYGVAPGQACVFYDSIKPISRILGGGWIVKNNNKNLN